jgi:RNA polymerase sigma-70 factor, ECF subfamily
MNDLGHVNETGARFHQELVNGDHLAPSKIAELFLPLLSRALHRKFHNIPDPHLVDTAVADALLSYLTNPHKFDPRRGKLFTYLWITSQSDLLNRLRQERKHTSRAVGEKAVELQSYATVNGTDAEEGPEAILLLSEEALRVREEVNAIITNEGDRAIVALMLDGARETTAYAEILGLTDKPLEEQALLVKRTKDRIKVALRRGLERRKPKP